MQNRTILIVAGRGILNLQENIMSYGVQVHFVCDIQRLAGATLLVFANKQDVPGAMTSEEIKEVLLFIFFMISKF